MRMRHDRQRVLDINDSHCVWFGAKALRAKGFLHIINILFVGDTTQGIRSRSLPSRKIISSISARMTTWGRHGHFTSQLSITVSSAVLACFPRRCWRQRES